MKRDYILRYKRGFFDSVDDILLNKDFLKLSDYYQHLGTSRLTHSIHVSYITWKIAGIFKLDKRSAARAGLLHDFCLYDFHANNYVHKLQLFYHPKAAARTSREHFILTDKENKAILSHMFPFGPVPTSREAWAVTTADKICAAAEFSLGLFAIAKTYFYALRPLLTRI
jgi:uncharacterized protein